MLSGIGPADELRKHGIRVIHEIPNVRKHLQDHVSPTIVLLQKLDTNDRMKFETGPTELVLARAQYAKDKSGLMSEMYGSTPMGFFKNEAVFNSEAYRALPKHTQEHLQKPTIPVYEIVTHIPPLFTGDHILKPTDSYLTAGAILMS
jgi:choline dehydrogenase-like flavoprotein